MVRLFKNNSPIGFILLIVYGLLVHFNLWMPNYAYEWISLDSSSIPFEWINQFLELVSQGNQWILRGIYFVLCLAQAFLINQLVNKVRLTQQRTLLPAMVHLLLLALGGEAVFLSPAFFALFFVFLVIIRLFETFNTKQFNTLFDVGFYSSMAAMIYPPAILLFIAVTMSLVFTRLFDWKEWGTILMGLFLPFYFLSIYLLFTPLGIMEYWQSWLPQLNWNWWQGGLGLKGWIRLATLTFLLLLSLWFFQSIVLKSELRIRKLLGVVVWLAIVATAINLVFSHADSLALALIFPPLSILTAFFWYGYPKKIRLELIPLGMLVLMVIMMLY